MKKKLLLMFLTMAMVLATGCANSKNTEESSQESTVDDTYQVIDDGYGESESEVEYWVDPDSLLTIEEKRAYDIQEAMVIANALQTDLELDRYPSDEKYSNTLFSIYEFVPTSMDYVPRIKATEDATYYFTVDYETKSVVVYINDYEVYPNQDNANAYLENGYPGQEEASEGEADESGASETDATENGIIENETAEIEAAESGAADAADEATSTEDAQ